MPNDISVSTASAAAEPYVPGAAAQTAASVQPAASVAQTGPGLPNPSIQLDPALNIVVIQLHNSKGDVTSSIPSQRQLDAYRYGQLPIPSAAGAEPAAAPPANPIAASPAPVATPAPQAHPAPVPAPVPAPTPAVAAPTTSTATHATSA